jgi:hypothetical protein
MYNISYIIEIWWPQASSTYYIVHKAIIIKFITDKIFNGLDYE